MTLATAEVADSYSITGTSFRAVIYLGLIYLSVAPAADVSDALSCLLPPSRLRNWTVEWSNDEPDGWDTYLVSRDTW